MFVRLWTAEANYMISLNLAEIRMFAPRCPATPDAGAGGVYHVTDMPATAMTRQDEWRAGKNREIRKTRREPEGPWPVSPLTADAGRSCWGREEVNYYHNLKRFNRIPSLHN
jgi:hypothetical protein